MDNSSCSIAPGTIALVGVMSWMNDFDGTISESAVGVAYSGLLACNLQQREQFPWQGPLKVMFGSHFS